MVGALRRLSLAVVVAAAVAVPAGTALAEQPFRLASQIEDRVGALEGSETDVQDALDELRSQEQIQLWLAYVDTFSGVGADEWAERTAEESDLGLSDALLAVATEDRAYAYSVDAEFPLSDDQLAEIAADDIEPQLADGDWAGAAIAAAEGIQDAADGDSGGGASAGWLWLVAGAVLLVAVAWWLLARSRRGAQAPAAEAEGDKLARVPLDELSKRGSSLLVEVDDAVKTSEQEVAFARAQFGDEAAAPFTAVVESAKSDLRKAFELRRALDDSTEESEAERRAMLTEIVTLTQGASDRLDAEAERFDELRSIERNAPELLGGLGRRLAQVDAAVPSMEAKLAALGSTYSAAAIATVADNVEQARERIAFARQEVEEGNREVQAGNPGRAAVAIRGAEEAIGQAEQLVEAIARLEQALAEADDKIRLAIPAVVEDIAAARAIVGSSPALAEHVARAEQSLAAAELAASTTDGQDPLGALTRLEEAGKALDDALVDVREAQEKDRRARAELDRVLAGTRAKLDAADDFVTTRRGAVGAEARTRLAEAGRYYEQALASLNGNATSALEYARTADGLAEQALRLAQRDVSRYGHDDGTSLPGGGAGGPSMGDLVMGGILIDLLRGAMGGGGSWGGGGGGGMRIPGGFGPGSFGGIGTRGRRGGGGRF